MKAHCTRNEHSNESCTASEADHVGAASSLTAFAAAFACACATIGAFVLLLLHSWGSEVVVSQI